jgi:hypothetical protein
MKVNINIKHAGIIAKANGKGIDMFNRGIDELS